MIKNHEGVYGTKMLAGAGCFHLVDGSGGGGGSAAAATLFRAVHHYNNTKPAPLLLTKSFTAFLRERERATAAAAGFVIQTERAPF